MDKLEEILNKRNLTRDDLARYLIDLFIHSGQVSTEISISQYSRKIWMNNARLKQYFGTWEDVKARLMDHFQLFYE